MLAGRQGYDVTSGKVLYEGRDLLGLAPEERATGGIFLAFQYPVEIPGLSNSTFLREAVNALRKRRGEPRTGRDAIHQTGPRQGARARHRGRHAEASRERRILGGEKKRNEVLQMALLQPRLSILDETDSGLDIDALRIVADGVNALRAPERSMLVITHYQRLLHYIVPDVVHVLIQGRILRSGGKELAEQVENEGYGGYAEAAA